MSSGTFFYSGEMAKALEISIRHEAFLSLLFLLSCGSKCGTCQWKDAEHRVETQKTLK